MKTDKSVLRLDRRMAGRPGWISPQDLEKALEALPDVSDKVAPPEDDDAPGDGKPGAG